MIRTVRFDAPFPGSPFALVIAKGNLATWQGDAVVNTAEEHLLGAVGDGEERDEGGDFGGGGVDAALHSSAGP